MIESCGELEAVRNAEVYAHRGDVDTTFRWLDSGVAARRDISWRAMGRRPLWMLAYRPLL